jgi:hypothetical protein
MHSITVNPPRLNTLSHQLPGQKKEYYHCGSVSRLAGRGFSRTHGITKELFGSGRAAIIGAQEGNMRKGKKKG